MKDLLAWWFFSKRAKRLCSIIKILIGLLIVSSFFSTLTGNMIDLIDAYVNPPLYLGKSFLLLPIAYSLFVKAVFWYVLFYLPYYIFGKRSEGTKKYLISILLISMLIGSFFAVGVYTKPSNVEVTRTQLALLEDRLGKINKMGEFYTVQEFGYDIAELTKDTPEFFLNEAEGFSKLALFYKDCEKEWKLYNVLPSTPTSIRTEYRLEHPEVDASLLFWGKVDRSVFRRGSSEGDEVMRLLRLWWAQYGIERNMRPKATWLDLKD